MTVAFKNGQSLEKVTLVYRTPTIIINTFSDQFELLFLMENLKNS